LTLVTGTGCLSCLFSSPGKYREQNGSENSNNGYYYQQLNEGEPSTMTTIFHINLLKKAS
jgi:hypothetical protein